VEQVKNALGASFSFTKIKTEANTLVTRYQALDQATKDELMNAFPIVSSVVNSKLWIKHIFGVDGRRLLNLLNFMCVL
jgi:hypothetical protein